MKIKQAVFFMTIFVISLDDSDPVGYIQSIVISSQPHVSLLGSVGAHEGVDLEGGDVVELLDGVPDLALVGLDVDEENEGVVVLDLLHGRLSGKGGLDDLELVIAGELLAGLGGILGVAGELKGLGPVEVGLGVETSSLGLLSSLKSLGNSSGFGGGHFYSGKEKRRGEEGC